jgi:hypothetical protein
MSAIFPKEPISATSNLRLTQGKTYVILVKHTHSLVRVNKIMYLFEVRIALNGDRGNTVAVQITAPNAYAVQQMAAAQYGAQNVIYYRELQQIG